MQWQRSKWAAIRPKPCLRIRGSNTVGIKIRQCLAFHFSSTTRICTVKIYLMTEVLIFIHLIVFKRTLLTTSYQPILDLVLPSWLQYCLWVVRGRFLLIYLLVFSHNLVPIADAQLLFTSPAMPDKPPLAFHRLLCL